MPVAISIAELSLSAVAFLAVTYITFAVWLRNPKSWTNRLFLLLGGILALYVPINYLSLNPPQGTPENQLFWIRVVMFLASIKGPALLLLAHTFPSEKILMPVRYLGILAISAIVGAAASLSPLVFEGVQYIDGQPLPIPGPGVILFLLNFGGSVILSFVILRFKYARSSGMERAKIYDFLIGILLTFILIIVATLFSIFIFQSSFAVFLGPIFPVILMAAIAHAVVKHKFLDIQPIIARAVSYFFLIVAMAVIYSSILFVTANVVVGYKFDIYNLFLGITLAIGIAISFQFLQAGIRKITDRVFFKGLYNFDELLAKLTQAMIAKIDLDELTKSLLEILTREMRVTKAAFLIIENHAIREVRGVGYREQDFMENSLESLLHDARSKSIRLIVFDELQDGLLKETFRKNDVMVAIPICSGDKEVALLILGPKSAGDLYSKKDLMLLEIFASESGIVIENAQLYENLKFALEAKSQFISVVSHQMRTPISAIRWSLELLQNKKITSAKRLEFMRNAYHNSIFLTEQLDDVLTALAIQDKGISVELEFCDLGSVTSELLVSFRHEIEKKNIDVKFNLGVRVASAMCDLPKIKKIIQVLLKNAIAYTKVGGRVEVSSEERIIGGKPNFLIAVTDTGIGLSSDEKEKIFGKFFRGETARLMLPDGMGLGMFIARAFVAAHGGRIWAESEGRDKGSTFYFAIPDRHREYGTGRVEGERHFVVKPALAAWANFVPILTAVMDSSAVIRPSATSDADDKDQFLSMLSHELKSPISTIKFIAEAILHSNEDLSGAERKKIQAIHEAAERALNLATDMINVSKFASGDMKPNFEMCDLKTTILNIIELLKPAAIAKNQKIFFDMPENLHLVKTCSEYLARAFQNVFDNAISYGNESSEISIILSENKERDSYVVGVHNFGPVIPESELPRIFEKFHRVPGSEKVKPTGTGLGLFIAKSAIELNGGKIWIESAPEKGTTVYFTVPFKAPRA